MRYNENLDEYYSRLKNEDLANQDAIRKIIDEEINNYTVVNPISNTAKEFMAKSIWMWRKMKEDKNNLTNESYAKELFTLVCVLDGFRSDPDAEDILQASREERILYSYFFYYKTLRVFNLDPYKNFIRRPLNEIDLGKKVIELDSFLPQEDKITTIIITSGASCPDSIVEGVIQKVLKLSGVSVG